MQVDLDNTDVAILKSLMEDGRKSFRAISREIKVSTPPTVKSRYERLVNIGLTKSVKPEIDLSKVTRGKKKKPVLWRRRRRNYQAARGTKETLPCKSSREYEGKKMQCEYCGGPINSKPKVLEFANFQRFFCCTGCKNQYKEKQEGRIRSIVEQYKAMQKGAKN